MIDVDECGRFVVAGVVRDEVWLRETLVRESKANRDPETGEVRLQARLRMHKEARFGAVRKLLDLLTAKDIRIWRITFVCLPEGEGGKQEEKPKAGHPNPVERPTVEPPAAKKAEGNGVGTEVEFWIRIHVREGSPPDQPAPRIMIDQRVMAGWVEVGETLKKLSQVPGLKKATVILDAEADALCGWAFRVLETLRELGFENINFKQ